MEEILEIRDGCSTPSQLLKSKAFAKFLNIYKKQFIKELKDLANGMTTSGEIRDKETAEIAVQAAMTGHMVLSTVHTNDALSVFSRLVDMGVEPFLVAAPIKVVQAQRLVRKLCTHCAEPVKVDPAVEKAFASLGMGFSSDWKKSVGCKRCVDVGYKGRTGIYEIYDILPKVRDMVVKRELISNIRQYYQDLGYRNLYQDGLIKAAKGQTTIEEVVRVTSGVEE